jgi:hypothetical protein
MRRDLRAYPRIERNYDAYDIPLETVHEDRLDGGVLVYIERVEIDDKNKVVDRQIEVAGYRHTPYFGKRKVSVIPEQSRTTVKSSLTELLERKFADKAPIIDFLFWN